jgi:hypothetical protein
MTPCTERLRMRGTISPISRLVFMAWWRRTFIMRLDGSLRLSLYQYSQPLIHRPIPVAARFKGWVCGHSLAGNAVSNPAGDMEGCLFWVLCVVRKRSLRRVGHSSRGALPSVVCLSVIEEPHRGGLGPLRLSNYEKRTGSWKNADQISNS